MNHGVLKKNQKSFNSGMNGVISVLRDLVWSLDTSLWLLAKKKKTIRMQIMDLKTSSRVKTS